MLRKGLTEDGTFEAHVLNEEKRQPWEDLGSRIPGRRSRSQWYLCGEWIPGVLSGNGGISRKLLWGPGEREPDATVVVEMQKNEQI